MGIPQKPIIVFLSLLSLLSSSVCPHLPRHFLVLCLSCYPSAHHPKPTSHPINLSLSPASQHFRYLSFQQPLEHPIESIEIRALLGHISPAISTVSLIAFTSVHANCTRNMPRPSSHPPLSLFQRPPPPSHL